MNTDKGHFFLYLMTCIDLPKSWPKVFGACSFGLAKSSKCYLSWIWIRYNQYQDQHMTTGLPTRHGISLTQIVLKTFTEFVNSFRDLPPDGSLVWTSVRKAGKSSRHHFGVVSLECFQLSLKITMRKKSLMSMNWIQSWQFVFLFLG